METKNALTDKKGISKVAAKGDNLQEALNAFNTEKAAEKLARKARGGKIWNRDAITAQYGPDMKVARRKLRDEQARLALSLISATKTNSKDQAKHRQALEDFSKKFLLNSKDKFTQISPENSPSAYNLLALAYRILHGDK